METKAENTDLSFKEFCFMGAHRKATLPGTVFYMEIHNEWSANCLFVMKLLIRLIESLHIRPTGHVWAEINSEHCAGSRDS